MTAPRTERFGLVDGQEVTRFTLGSDHGLVLRVLDLGATVQELWVPDGAGAMANVVLGADTAEEYAATPSQYFGATVGRFANRIAHGTFTLDGVTHEVAVNDGPNSLHGGPDGFHRRLWAVTGLDDTGLTLDLTSPDGDQGFPGTLSVSVSYRVVGLEVQIRYRAESDAATVVNLTNHAHFNLAGEGAGSIEDHVLHVDADRYTPVGADLIPPGHLVDVSDSPLDFRVPTRIGARIRADHEQLRVARGYDHNFVLNGSESRPAVTLSEPGSGRTLEVRTDQPGVQVYTGNFFDGSRVGPSGSAYRQGDGVALETQHFPDSPNQPAFPSTVLRPGEVFTSWTSWSFVPSGRVRG